MSNILQFPERRSAIDLVKHNYNLDRLTNPVLDALQIMVADAKAHDAYVKASIDNGEMSFNHEDVFISHGYVTALIEVLELIKDLSGFYNGA